MEFIHKKILEKLKEENPKLFDSEAEIKIVELESNENLVDVNTINLEIHIWHPFIFDNRLIPTTFFGYTVRNITYSNTVPKIFTSEEDSYPLWKVENPLNYISFVEDNISEIQIKLKSKTLSKYEALEAITGGFQQFLKKWDKMVNLNLS